ncbi:DUF4253 domain-containing protein [Actinokineospora xionganensis]|uniref:DUF4253 domain-containing protein n=1 Tax=Actinokineospora xionganensis TaxID=2684470 RepID=A0ABR7L3M3_9PSEU|nr:DUF4253 domain-containing protein [Actinokineospora xionganensis]MBC6447113.1 DUF4253 domain-containing protein [Actinokineospora xionganensis]
MIAHPPLPAEVQVLFVDGDAVGRTLSVPLPPGQAVVSDEGNGDGPVLWLSARSPESGLWARLRAEHGRSGLWPLLLQAHDVDDDEFRPWGAGELFPAGMSKPQGHDPAALLAGWWADHTTVAEDVDMLPPAERLAVTAPYGRDWPGLAPSADRGNDPDRVADDLADELLAVFSKLRLGLVAADRGSDALTVAGWVGPLNHTNDTAEISAVVADWERRFGVRVVGVGFATLDLSVAAPPTTHEQALAVAAEHFAFCPDNVWQGREPCTLTAYAERLVGERSWSFWWD